LTERAQGPELGAESVHDLNRGGRGNGGAGDRDFRGALSPIDRYGDVAVLEAVVRDLWPDRREVDALFRNPPGGRLFARRRCALGAALIELAPGEGAVNELPLTCALRLGALGEGREDVGEITTNLALVDEARETAGAGQDAEQRHLGQ